MKALYTFLAIVTITAGVWAQSPMKMSYQAVIRNTSDELVTNQPIGLRISILQGSANGNLVYFETQTTISNSIGLVSIEVGGGPGFDAINWANGPYFIRTETDPEGGTNYTISNTSQLLSVPYALHAKTAEAFSDGITETDPIFSASPAKTISGSDIINWNSKQDKLIAGKHIVITGDSISATGLPPDGKSPGDMLYWNGSAWVVVPPGTHGKILYFCNGVPTWGGCPPLLTTTLVYGITPTTATSGGYVTNDGGSPVTARGICWSTSASPDITDNHTMDGSDTGTFVSSITNLLPNTTYYVRTYATNSSGTAYGNEVSFTTSSNNESTTCYSAPDGVIACWSYKDFIIPEGFKVDSAFMDASRPGYPQDEYDFIIGYCQGKTSYDSAVATIPLDYTAITSPMYKTWLNLTNHNINVTGVMRVTLPTCNGAVWNALCIAISPSNQTAACFAAPDGTNDYNWSYKDYVIPEGYKVDSVFMDASRPGYSEDKYDLLIAYCPGTSTYASSKVIFLFEYESVTTPMYNTWLNLTNLSVKATGMVRVKLPTHERAVWNNLCFAISEISDSSWKCGESFTVNHVSGAVAPVSKTVTYGTVTNIPGEPAKCWITQNLGADHQASSLYDGSETSAGWCWQFNRKQGYKTEGTIRTPNTTWVRMIDENSDWSSANDPCAIELGNGWRIPTSNEWIAVHDSGKWDRWADPWNSNLHLHAAKYIDVNGFIGDSPKTLFWSSSEREFSMDTMASLGGGAGGYSVSKKAFGWPLRCIRDPNSQLPIPTVTTSDLKPRDELTFIGGGNVTDDGGFTVTSRGICWNTSSNPTITNRHTVDGKGTGNFTSLFYDFTPGTIYYVRAYATNSMGTGYGNEITVQGPTPAFCQWVQAVTTNPVSMITARTALGSGEKEYTGGAQGVNEYWGFYISTKPDFSPWGDPHTIVFSSGADTNRFIGNICCLTPGTNYYVRAYSKNYCGNMRFGEVVSFTTLPDSNFICGDDITINHSAGSVAPVTQTVAYGTVTNIPGEPSKCWITQNLGADHEAKEVNDSTEASVGWYWQFNSKQGYKHDGTTRTPNTTWVFIANENSDWAPQNDPCTLELGNGWRIPTSTEWTNVDAAGNWTNWNGPWNSGLKLNASGLIGNNGLLFSRGTYGNYWSSFQSSGYGGWSLHFSSDRSDAGYKSMGYGFSIRCVKD